MKLHKLFCTLDLSLPRDAMQARPSRPAVSVCLSVCPSRSWILSKRINILQTFFQTGSHNILVVPYIWLHCVLNTATARCYQHGAARPWKVVALVVGSKRRNSFLPRDAMHKRGLCRHTVSLSLSLSLCVSVTFVHCVKTNKDIFKFFSPSGSYTILVFPHQTGWQYCDGIP